MLFDTLSLLLMPTLGIGGQREIQKRGRWSVPSSTNHDSKSHVCLELLAGFSPDLVNEGERLFTLWGTRKTEEDLDLALKVATAVKELL